MTEARAEQLQALVAAAAETLKDAATAAADRQLSLPEGLELGLDLVALGGAVIALCTVEAPARRARRLAWLKRSRRAFIEPG
jgi:hypothetical protein